MFVEELLPSARDGHEDVEPALLPTTLSPAPSDGHDERLSLLFAFCAKSVSMLLLMLLLLQKLKSPTKIIWSMLADHLACGQLSGCILGRDLCRFSKMYTKESVR